MEPKGKKMLKNTGIVFVIWGILVAVAGVILISTSGMLGDLGDSREMQILAIEYGMTTGGLMQLVKLISYGLMINGAFFAFLGIMGIAFCKVLHMSRLLRVLSIILIIICAINLGLGMTYGYTLIIAHTFNILLGFFFFIGAERNVHSLNMAKAASTAAKADALTEKVEKMEMAEKEHKNTGNAKEVQEEKEDEVQA